MNRVTPFEIDPENLFLNLPKGAKLLKFSLAPVTQVQPKPVLLLWAEVNPKEHEIEKVDIALFYNDGDVPDTGLVYMDSLAIESHMLHIYRKMPKQVVSSSTDDLLAKKTS